MGYLLVVMSGNTCSWHSLTSPLRWTVFWGRCRMAGNLVLRTWISQDFPRQFSHIIILLTTLRAPSGAKIHHHHSGKSGRILTPTWRTDTMPASSVTLTLGLTTTTEDAEMISSMKTGVPMAGAMTTRTRETPVERGSGVRLDTDEGWKEDVLGGSF